MNVLERATTVGPRLGAGETGPVKVIWDDGDEFEGLLRMGDPAEPLEGEMRWKGGDRFVGRLDRRGLMQGRGWYWYADGRTYAGEFRDGRRHGRGEMRGAGGHFYSGEWREDERHGRGCECEGEGEGGGWRHEGEFFGGSARGWGRREHGDGTTHEGEWRQLGERTMLADGRAIFSQADGHRMLERWRGGRPTGTAHPLRRGASEARREGERKSAPEMVPDEKETCCFVCQNRFSLTVRRSHCRNCGEIVCSECLERMVLPWKNGKLSKICVDCYIVRRSKG